MTTPAATTPTTAIVPSFFEKMKSSLSDLSSKVTEISKKVFKATSSALQITGTVITGAAILTAGTAAIILGVAGLITLSVLPFILAASFLEYTGLVPATAVFIL